MPAGIAKSYFRKCRTIAIGVLCFSGSLNSFSQGRVNGGSDPPEPSPAPHFNGTNLPTPPKQHTSWIPPVSRLPTNYISATRALFDAGLADPRGCEYREIEVPVASVPGAYPPRLPGAETGRVKTHGWVLPAKNNQRFAVCWNGLVYPVLTVGTNVSLKADVGNLTTNGVLPWDNGILEAASVSHTSLLGIKGCLLLRLGESDLARRYWQGKLLQEKQPRWLWLRTPLTNSPATLGELQLPETDPFPDWAIEWTWALFDRATFAHMRGDDGIALASARMLFPIQYIIQAEVEKRELKQLNEKYGKGSPNLPPPLRRDLFLTFSKDLPALLADQERRLSKSRRQTVIATGITNYPNRQKRVAALIEDLDEVSGNRRYGFGAWYGDKTVDAIVSEGDDAVEPLLKCLERDEKKLTRSITVSTSRHTGVTRERQLRYVEEPITEILLGIMQTTCVGSWATTNELAEAGTNKNRIKAAQMRAYWRKFKDVPLAERWYLTLLDDNASASSWSDALANIVSPVTSPSPLPNHPRSSSKVFPNQAPTFRGAPLMSKTNPSVTELLIKRAPSLDVFSIAKWDSQAAIPLMHAEMQKHLALWANAGRFVPWSGEYNNAGGYGCAHAANMIIALTVERARAGDLDALEEYASWACSLTLPHYRVWSNKSYGRRELCEPMWKFPTHPAVSNCAVFLFSSPKSPLAPDLSLTNGTRSYVVERCQSRLMCFPAFRQLVLAGLQNTNEMGVALLNTNGWFSIRTRFSNGGRALGSNYDASRAIIGKDVTIRLCDHLAKELSVWEGMPKIELYWQQSFRDEALAECIRQVQEHGEEFARRTREKPSHPWPPRPWNDD